LVPEEVALPAPGSQGIELRTAVPVLGPYLDDPLETMLLPDDEVDWAKYHEICPFGVPELKEENPTSAGSSHVGLRGCWCL
jgi:hypothetical protein